MSLTRSGLLVSAAFTDTDSPKLCSVPTGPSGIKPKKSKHDKPHKRGDLRNTCEYPPRLLQASARYCQSAYALGVKIDLSALSGGKRPRRRTRRLGYFTNDGRVVPHLPKTRAATPKRRTRKAR